MPAGSATHDGHYPASNDDAGINYPYRDSENNASYRKRRRNPGHPRTNDDRENDENREEKAALARIRAGLRQPSHQTWVLGQLCCRNDD